MYVKIKARCLLEWLSSYSNTTLGARRESSPPVHDRENIGEGLPVGQVGGLEQGIFEELVFLVFGIYRYCQYRLSPRFKSTALPSLLHPSPKKMRSTRLAESPLTIKGRISSGGGGVSCLDWSTASISDSEKGPVHWCSHFWATTAEAAAWMARRLVLVEDRILLLAWSGPLGD